MPHADALAAQLHSDNAAALRVERGAEGRGPGVHAASCIGIRGVHAAIRKRLAGFLALDAHAAPGRGVQGHLVLRVGGDDVHSFHDVDFAVLWPVRWVAEP